MVGVGTALLVFYFIVLAVSFALYVVSGTL